MWSHYRWMTLGVVAILTACSLGPNYKRPKVDLPGQYRNDQGAACEFLSQVLAAPRLDPHDDELDYISIRRRDGSLLAFAVQHHPEIGTQPQ